MRLDVLEAPAPLVGAAAAGAVLLPCCSAASPPLGLGEALGSSASAVGAAGSGAGVAASVGEEGTVVAVSVAAVVVTGVNVPGRFTVGAPLA